MRVASKPFYAYFYSTLSFALIPHSRFVRSKARMRMRLLCSQFFVYAAAFLTPTESRSSSLKNCKTLRPKLRYLKAPSWLYDNQFGLHLFLPTMLFIVWFFCFESSCLFIHSSSFFLQKIFRIASAWLYFSGLMELTFRWVSISFLQWQRETNSRRNAEMCLKTLNVSDGWQVEKKSKKYWAKYN